MSDRLTNLQKLRRSREPGVLDSDCSSPLLHHSITPVPLTSPADRGGAGTSRLWVVSLCRLRYDWSLCRRRPTIYLCPSSPLSDHRCGRPYLWRGSPWDRGCEG